MVQDGTAASVADRKVHASFIRTWTSPEVTPTIATAAVLLPTGASKLEVHTGVNGAQIDIETLGGRELVIATATVSDDSVPLISSITYTDASGKRVTDKG